VLLIIITKKREKVLYVVLHQVNIATPTTHFLSIELCWFMLTDNIDTRQKKIFREH